MEFNDYSWHDAVIKHIEIDRTNPGINDTVLLDVVMANEEEKLTFVFDGVYQAEMRLNFGIVADETILDAMELDSDNVYAASFYSSWKGLMDSVRLKTYKIELNSTGGEIRILAKGCSLHKDNVR